MRIAAGEAQRRVAEAAGAAIAARAALSAIAEAERAGKLRARGDLGADVLRQVARAAKRKRDADDEYEQAIRRAGRLGLSHREIASAADVSHGTVRAILAPATPRANGRRSHRPPEADEPARDWRDRAVSRRRHRLSGRAQR